jgi:isoleucyl-tRNA synthetase
LRAEDGEKMSKSKKNFPDPWIFIDKYGVDALRIYLMSSTLMKGEDANFSEKTVQDIASKIVGRLFNVLSFYELYREKSIEENKNIESKNVLDEWIVSRLYQTLNEITKGMEGYDMAEATRPIDLFVDDLSTWYLRRSRERIKDGDKEAKQTLYFVLKTFAKVLAPFAPFSAEDIWLSLKNTDDAESVHLTEWPKESFKDILLDKITGKSKVLENMKKVRNIVSLGLESRQKAGIKVRQPLNLLKVKSYELESEYTELIKDELNIKEVLKDENIETEVLLDLEITEELKQEGDYRELARALQDMRKNMGLTPSDMVSVFFETNEAGKNLIQKFEDDLKKTVLVSNIEFKNNEGLEIKIGELIFKTKIEK